MAMPAAGQDATWLANPGSGNFNTGTNWDTGTVPTGVATFDQSTRTSITFPGSFQFYDVDALRFNAGAPAYSFATGPNFVSLNGAGIIDNSSNAPTFNVDGQLRFFNSSTAADAIINATSGRNVQFSDGSTAGNATVTADGFAAVQFSGNSTGGNARFIANGSGSIDFSNSTGPGGTNQLSAGSLEGSGTFALGGNELTVGSNNLSTEVTGVVSGSGGSLVKTGTGALTLSGANTYTGGTTISTGTVVLNHIDATNLFDALGTGGVTLDGGALVAGTTGSLANDLTFAANKTSILAATAGTTLTLGGDPNTTGNTNTNFTVNGGAVIQFGTATDTGTVRFGASSQLPTINGIASVDVAGGTLQDLQDSLWQLLVNVSSVTVESGATLDYNDSVLQYLINLNGAGAVKTGTTGTNSLLVYSLAGSTNTFSGVISGSHPVTFETPGGAATMILSGDNTYTGGTTICSCMTLQLGNGGTTGSILGDVDNEGTLVFNRSNTYAFGGVISGGGDLIQSGSGKTILSVTETYTGATTVNGGILSVNGDITASSGVTVNSGGALGGTGIVPTTIINAGGALAPGNSIGTLTVSGNLTFNSGSNYNIEVSPSAADRANVTGTAALAGTVNASYATGAYIAKRYTVLNATNVTGTFGSLVNSNLPANFTSSLGYDSKNVYLDLVLNYVAPTAPSYGSGLNGNQQNVADALTAYFNTTGGIPTVFGTLSPAGLTQVSGEIGTTPTQALFTASNQFMNLLSDQGGSATGSGAGALGYAPGKTLDAKAAEAYAAVTPRDRRAPDFASRWGVWGAGYGGNATVSGDAATGSSDTTTRVYGGAGGAEYRFTPDTVAGFALGGAGTNFSAGEGSGRADIFQAGVYARHYLGAAYVSGALAYGWQRVTTDRTVTVSGTDKLEANFDARTFVARLESGYRFATPWLGLTPYGALQSTNIFLPSYAESAVSGSNQFALAYGSRTVTNLRTELGLRVDRTFAVADGVFALNGRAAWAHDSNTDRLATATFQTLPGATFTVNGAEPAPDGALLSAGAKMDWANGMSLSATFDGEFSRTTVGYAGRASFAYKW